MKNPMKRAPRAKTVGRWQSGLLHRDSGGAGQKADTRSRRLDALAKASGYERPVLCRHTLVWFSDQKDAVHFNGTINLWRASLSSPAAGSEDDRKERGT